MLALACVMGGCGKPDNAPQPADPAALRKEVIAQVQSGGIKPDATGLAHLPPEVQSASADGRVYISTDPSAGFLVAFSLQGGSGFGRGLLYVERPVATGTRNVKVGNIQLVLMHPVDEHWYEVAALSR